MNVEEAKLMSLGECKTVMLLEQILKELQNLSRGLEE